MMAKRFGWWKIEFTEEPEQDDLDHIAQLIKDGYTEGEIADSSFEEYLESETEE
jgi:hypothetical protein